PPATSLLAINCGLQYTCGQVITQPAKSYSAGQTATAVFATANPDIDLQQEGSYLLIEKQTGATWKVVATDADIATRFRYADKVTYMSATMTWDIPPATKGTFRITHNG